MKNTKYWNSLMRSTEIRNAIWEDFFAIIPVTIAGKRHYFKTVQRRPHKAWDAGVELGLQILYHYRLKVES